MSVLVIDPCPDNASSLADLLAMFGYEVHTARTARAALLRVAADRPDAVITEARLPDLDAFALARRLAEALGHPPALILHTGYPDQDARAEAAGFARHFVKPADPAELVRAVAELAAAEVGWA